MARLEGNYACPSNAEMWNVGSFMSMLNVHSHKHYAWKQKTIILYSILYAGPKCYMNIQILTVG